MTAGTQDATAPALRGAPGGAAVAGRSHIAALDGVRGVAILLVIAYHCHELAAGWMGVDIFFVLSGYLITGILVSARTAPHYWRNFLGRRALRILPPYVAYVLVATVVLPRLGILPEAHGAGWVWSYLTNVRLASTGAWDSIPTLTEHLWSVAVEEQFYLIWPLVVYFLPLRTLRRVCIGASVVALALRVALVVGHVNDLAPAVLMPARMDGLMIGSWAAVTKFRPARAATAIAAASLAAVLLLQLPLRLILAVGYSAIALASGVIVAAAVASPRLGRMLAWKPLRLAGRYSYTAYLIHPLVLALLRTYFLPDYSRRLAAAVVVVTFGIAALSWRLFEAPILRLKRFFPEPVAALTPRAGRAT